MNEPKALKQHRMEQAYSIRSLATEAGVSPQTVTAIERGNPARKQSFRRLAEALNIAPMDIAEYRNLVETENRAQDEPERG